MLAPSVSHTHYSRSYSHSLAHKLSVLVWSWIWLCTDDVRPDLLLIHDPDRQLSGDEAWGETHATGLLLWPRMRVRSQGFGLLSDIVAFFRGVAVDIDFRPSLPLLAPRCCAAKALSACLTALSGGFSRADRRANAGRKKVTG